MRSSPNATLALLSQAQPPPNTRVEVSWERPPAGTLQRGPVGLYNRWPLAVVAVALLALLLGFAVRQRLRQRT